MVVPLPLTPVSLTQTARCSTLLLNVRSEIAVPHGLTWVRSTSRSLAPLVARNPPDMQATHVSVAKRSLNDATPCTSGSLLANSLAPFVFQSSASRVLPHFATRAGTLSPGPELARPATRFAGELSNHSSFCSCLYMGVPHRSSHWRFDGARQKANVTSLLTHRGVPPCLAPRGSRPTPTSPHS